MTQSVSTHTFSFPSISSHVVLPLSLQLCTHSPVIHRRRNCAGRCRQLLAAAEVMKLLTEGEAVGVIHLQTLKRTKSFLSSSGGTQ